MNVERKGRSEGGLVYDYFYSIRLRFLNMKSMRKKGREENRRETHGRGGGKSTNSQIET